MSECVEPIGLTVTFFSANISIRNSTIRCKNISGDSKIDPRNYGYLVPNGYVVDTGGYTKILPLNPAAFHVPFYDPVVVLACPKHGLVVGTAIRSGPAITISATFGTWGMWTGPALFWSAHTIVIGGHPWERGWVNRGVYVHPYAHPWFARLAPEWRFTIVDK